MKSFLSFLSSCLLVLGLTACGTARDEDQAGNTFCFGCHSETSELGKKISWAEAGWDNSVHAKGQIGRVFTKITSATQPPPAGWCTPWPDAACFVPVAQEFEGSNAFYANSGGCQMCHTQEGFRKRVAGEYDARDGTYSIKYAWNTAAAAGSVTAPNANNPLTSDVIEFPSPLGCFGCHTPHGQGTPDGKTLPQTIPVGTPITTQTGARWAESKAKGHICAECHEIRLNAFATTADSIVSSVTSTATSGPRFTVSAPYGPHHGPQTDMNLGEGGAEYVGTTAEGFTFAGTLNERYGNSPHFGRAGADCISCHAQSDVSDIEVTGSFGVNAAVGGHSFRNKGFVHGAEKALVIGCGSTGCHTAAGVATSTGNRVVAASVGGTAASGATPFSGPSEYLQRGDAYFQKLTGPTPSAADSNYHLKVNELLAKLARPSDDCKGLLMDAADLAANTTDALGWAKMEDQTTIDRRCISTGSNTGKGILRAVNPRDNNTNASVRFLKGLWNFKYILVEDKSFGVHNTTYALQLLYDSCTDLALLTGQDCGTTAGRCSFCEGTFVTGRP